MADWEADARIVEAIEEGIRAGVYRRAARLNPKTARTWQSFADLHSERVQALLDEMLNGPDADVAGPCSRCGL